MRAAALLAFGLGAPAAGWAETVPIHVRFADGAGHQCDARACTGPNAGLLTTARHEGVVVDGCYGLPEAHLRGLAVRGEARSGLRTPDLTQCFTLTAPDESAARRWVSRLSAAPGVLWVERATPVYPAQMPVPDFSADQFILEDAPLGLGIRRFWAQTGSRGAGVTFIDLEVGLDARHVELARFGDIFDARGAGSVFFPAEETDDHGLACSGIVLAAVDGRGTDGIAPDARPYFFTAYPSEYTWGVGPALLRALGTLSPGDVVLLELQRPGPAYDADRDPSGQWGMVPVEWSRVDRDALRTASALGIAVIEPAGNGSQDLDDPIYEGRFTDADSGALMVGAGNPPTGDFGAARDTMSYSNFGTRVDLQGYGAQIVSPGYGDLWGAPGSPDRYTGSFAGTSAAAPQVAGVAVLLASLLRPRGAYLSPTDLRTLLAETGTAGAASIGPLPDAAAAAARAPEFATRMPPPETPREWSACRADGDCRAAPGLTCVEARRNEGYCLPACEPFAPVDESVCERGFGCGLQVWGGGVCLRREGAGHTGDRCLSEMDCDLNYYCDQNEGCQPLCSVRRDAGCGAGQTCLFAGDLFGDWGVCAVVRPNPDGRPDGAPCDQDADCQGGTCYDSGTNERPLCTTLGCRNDVDCHGDGAVCIIDAAVGIPYCGLSCRGDRDCAPGQVCSDGTCSDSPTVECVVDADCADGRVCDGAGVCVARPAPDCVVDADCADGRVCSGAGVCVVAPGCRLDADCEPRERCVEGTCARRPGCVDDADCPAGQSCVDGQCFRVPSPVCPVHRVLQGGRCVSDGTCEAQSDCDARYLCESGRCVRSAACSADLDCIEGWRCVVQVCVPPRCREDAQCGPGFVCIEGLCAVPPCVVEGTCGAPTSRDAGGTEEGGADVPVGPPDALGVNPLAPDAGEGLVPGGRGCACQFNRGNAPALPGLGLALGLLLRPRRRSGSCRPAAPTGSPRHTEGPDREAGR